MELYLERKGQREATVRIRKRLEGIHGGRGSNFGSSSSDGLLTAVPSRKYLDYRSAPTYISLGTIVAQTIRARKLARTVSF